MGDQLSCSAPPQHMTASGCGGVVRQMSLVVLPGMINRGCPLAGLTGAARAVLVVGCVCLVIGDKVCLFVASVPFARRAWDSS
jgi:hypothetical protein